MDPEDRVITAFHCICHLEMTLFAENREKCSSKDDFFSLLQKTAKAIKTWYCILKGETGFSLYLLKISRAVVMHGLC